ncbi:MAG: FIST N-terminal domain-containing protein [Planctomycetota bacterium]
MSYRSMELSMLKWAPIFALSAIGATWATQTAVAAEKGDIVVKVVMVEDEDEDPAAAGKAAAESLKKAMGRAALKAVIISECFEDREQKEKLLKGVCSVLPDEVVMGGATYGSFTQEGCTDFDAVCLMGIGGDGIGVSARLVTDMGTAKLTFEQDQELVRKRLHKAGKDLAGKLRRTDRDRVLILIADAHAPKNQYLVEGVQLALGKQFPIVGGCVNKNAGQTFVYFGGKVYEDAAMAVMLSGDFEASLTGRQANENEKVIATANQAAREALEAVKGKPVAALAFNCAGRRSKLKDYGEELAAIQKALGEEVPLFGCYCAGEIGPVDNPEQPSDALSGGSGWHVMFTVIAQ